MAKKNSKLMNNNFDYFSTYRKAPQLYYKKFSLKSIIFLFKSILKDFLNLFQKEDIIEKNKIWIISNTLNNRNSTEFVTNYYTDSISVKFGGKKSLQIKTIFPHRNFIGKFIKTVVFFITSNDHWSRHNIHYLYDTIYMEKKIENLLLSSLPKLIIFSNDHYYYNRILLKKAREKNITTIYIPHASVSGYFPKLEFDYSFLYGKQMEDTYLKVGESLGKIDITGSIRSQNLKFLKKESYSERTLGIAINPMDNIKDIRNLVAEIVNMKSFQKIIIRFHPRMKINKFLIDPIIEYSSASESSINIYLSQINILIAGNSGIHLEAAISGTKSITMYFSDQFIYDYYGFIENKISQYSSSLITLTNILNKDIVYPKEEYLSYYDYSVTNSELNETSFRILEKINLILKNI